MHFLLDEILSIHAFIADQEASPPSYFSYTDVCWHTLTYADVCWRMQQEASPSSYFSYTDVCWHTQTYADVCWRMLTYASDGQPAALLLRPHSARPCQQRLRTPFCRESKTRRRWNPQSDCWVGRVSSKKKKKALPPSFFFFIKFWREGRFQKGADEILSQTAGWGG